MVPKVFLSHSHFKSTSTAMHAHNARAFSSRVTPSTSIHVDVKVGRRVGGRADVFSTRLLFCNRAGQREPHSTRQLRQESCVYKIEYSRVLFYDGVTFSSVWL